MLSLIGNVCVISIYERDVRMKKDMPIWVFYLQCVKNFILVKSCKI